MNDVYLIKKETLTAIADAMRASTPWNGVLEESAIAPDEIPDMLKFIRTDGYDEGYYKGQASGGGSTDDRYDEGYNDGLAEAYVPDSLDKVALMMQAINVPTLNNHYGVDEFDNSNHFGYYDFFDYEQSVNSDVSTVNIINYTNLKMDVIIDIDCEYYTGSEWVYGSYTITFSVEPDSSNSGSVQAGMGSQYDWYHPRIWVRFYK